MYKLWNDEEIEKLKGYVNKKISFDEMSKYFPNRTAASLQKKSIKLKLVHLYRPQKHFVDLEFFGIPNLINSYISGNFAADGYIKKRGNNNVYLFTWQVNTKDVSILENVKNLTKYTGNIRSYQRKNYQKDTYKNVSYIVITCANQWAEDLKNNFGIIPHKTLRMSPPNLLDDILKHSYIIGYCDGDGSVSIRNSGKYQRLELKFYSCNQIILDWVKKELDKICLNVSWTDNKQNLLFKKNKNVCEYRFSDIKAAILIDYFRQFPVPKLSRKWENPEILARIEEYKQKYPQYFKIIPDGYFNKYLI